MSKPKAQRCGECGQPLPHGYARETLSFYVPEPGEVVGTVGVINSGKSKLMKEWAAYLQEKGESVICPTDVSWEMSRHGIIRKWTQLGPLRDQVTVSEFLANPAVLRARKLSLAIVADDPMAPLAVKAEGIRQVLPYLRQRIEPVHILWEEAGLLSEFLAAEFCEVAGSWRKDGPISYFVGQYWTQFPKGVRSQCSKIISFAQCDSTDLRFLSQEGGRSFARDVASLAPGEHAVRDRRRVHADTLAELDT